MIESRLITINVSRAYAPIDVLAMMINNANNSIIWPINRITRNYWLLLPIIAI
jgi:hypothetical protein